MEEQLRRICAVEGVEGITIWPDGNRFLGCLLDSCFQQIGGSVVWLAEETLEQVLNSLERASQGLKRQNEERLAR